jgi:hypothetical protein
MVLDSMLLEKKEKVSSVKAEDFLDNLSLKTHILFLNEQYLIGRHSEKENIPLSVKAFNMYKDEIKKEFSIPNDEIFYEVYTRMMRSYYLFESLNYY